MTKSGTRTLSFNLVYDFRNSSLITTAYFLASMVLRTINLICHTAGEHMTYQGILPKQQEVLNKDRRNIIPVM